MPSSKVSLPLWCASTAQEKFVHRNQNQLEKKKGGIINTFIKYSDYSVITKNWNFVGFLQNGTYCLFLWTCCVMYKLQRSNVIQTIHQMKCQSDYVIWVSIVPLTKTKWIEAWRTHVQTATSWPVFNLSTVISKLTCSNTIYICITDTAGMLPAFLPIPPLLAIQAIRAQIR